MVPSINQEMEVASGHKVLRRLDISEQYRQLRFVGRAIHRPSADYISVDGFVDKEGIQHNFKRIVIEFPFGEAVLPIQIVSKPVQRSSEIVASRMFLQGYQLCLRECGPHGLVRQHLSCSGG